jgi:hypothetical protein
MMRRARHLLATAPQYYRACEQVVMCLTAAISVLCARSFFGRCSCSAVAFESSHFHAVETGRQRHEEDCSYLATKPTPAQHGAVAVR